MAKNRFDQGSIGDDQIPPVVESAKVNLAAFCVIRKHEIGISARLKVWLSEANDLDEDKTLEAWDEIYEKAMNRVTH